MTTTDNGRRGSRRLARTARRGIVAAIAVLASVVASSVVSGSTLEPASAAAALPAVDRLAGEDRFQTAIAISRSGYPQGASTVYVATGTNYPDALSAAPAAAVSSAPLLLTESTVIPEAVIDEIIRLAPSTIVVIGGESAVSADVFSRLEPLAATVDRISGSDRFETSELIAEYAFGTATSAYIATGLNYPDALAASAAAGAGNMPMVLVNGGLAAVDGNTTELLARLGVASAIIAGGTAAVSLGFEASLRATGAVVERRAGADRFETAVAVNRVAFPSGDRVYLANAASFSDALAGAALAGKQKAPLYLVQSTCLAPSTLVDVRDRLRATKATLLGGKAVLTDSVATLIDCDAWTKQQKSASEAELVNKLNALMPSLPGVYSVAVREASGLKRAVSIRGRELKEPASSIKLFPAYAALKLVDEGRISLEQRTSSGTTIRECMRAMIHISDNPCHVELIAFLGQQNLNDMFVREGYLDTHYVGWSNGTYYSSKHSSADDLALLLTRLNSGQLLSPSSTAHLRSLMGSQIWRTRVAAGIPPGVAQESKIGSLWVDSGMVDTDAAIVYAPNSTYVLTAMGSRGANASGIARISRVVYEHFNGPFGAAATYPQQQLYTTQAVTLYSGAGTGAIRSLPAGTWVEAIDSVRVWYRVKVAGRTGYINSNYMANR